MGRRTNVILACIAGALGCDAQNVVDEPVETAAHHEPTNLSSLPAPDGETPPAVKPTTKAGRGADLSTLPHPDAVYPTPAAAKAKCESACNAEGRSDDDRATCRLDCGDTKPDRPSQVTRRFLDCTSTCDPQDHGCVTVCGDAVRAVGRTELSYDPFCASVCLDTLPRCRGECLAPSHDDSATCRLHCEQDGARCLRACSERAANADQASATPHAAALDSVAAKLGNDEAGQRARQLIDDAGRDIGTMLVDVRAAAGDAKTIATINDRVATLAHRLGEGVIASSEELSPDRRAALDEYGDLKLTIPLRNLMKEVAEARAPG